MRESDILLSRAEKLRRDARSVRSEASRLSMQSDRQRLLDVAQNLETDARDLEACARRRAHDDEQKLDAMRAEARARVGRGVGAAGGTAKTA
jgi:hypothetical protein